MMPPPVDGALARDDSAPDRDRVKLARKWAYLLSQVTYVPWPHSELEGRLRGLVDELVAIIAGRPFDPDGAEQVGRQLVRWQLTDPAALRLTTTVLGKGLLALPELGTLGDLAERVVAVSGTLAAGYGEQIRLFILEQQESLNRALARAVHNAERDLRLSEARFDRVAVCSPSGIAITDTDGRFVRANAALARILGRRPGELELDGRSLFEMVTPERADQLRLLYEGLAAGRSAPPRQLLRLLGADGTITTVSAVASPLPDPDGEVRQFVTVFEDVSELTLLRDELCRQALHDLHTGLPNRQYYTTRLEEALHRADPRHGITLYLLDLDAFSLITAGLGRDTSERLLISVAERLKSVVDGESAMVARFEGDEFGILVENTEHTPGVRETVARILAALAEPVDIGGRELSVSASIGVVRRPAAGPRPVDLLSAAELTLRRAQRNPSQRWAMFDAAANQRDRETYLLAAELPGALRSGRLTVSYRPIRRLADDRAVGLTARLRWVRRGAGVLGHDRCVALAEEAGVVQPLGAWLVRTACAEFRAWADREATLHLQLAAAQAADPDLYVTVATACVDAELAPDRVRIGIPAVVLRDNAQVRANLRLLTDLGAGVVATGFGAVPADLAGIEELRLSAVRVRDPGREVPAEPVRTLLDAVRASGVGVIVDDIGTEEQAGWWRGLGADLVEGDGIAPAGPADSVPFLLR